MRIFTPILALMTAAFLFLSCQKEISYEIDNDHGGGSNISTGTFKANINGNAWEADAAKQTALIIDGIINIDGISSNGQRIRITVAGDTVGTYDLSKTGEDGILGYLPSYSDTTNSYTSNAVADTASSNGTLVITSIDTVNKKISGTFKSRALNAKDGTSYQISEGSFELTYFTSLTPVTDPTTPTTPTGPSAGANTIKGTINGAAWQAAGNGVAATGIIVLGGNDAKKAMTLTIPADAKAGNYPIDEFSQNYTVDYFDLVNPTRMYNTRSGNLKITSHDPTSKTIAGTFDIVTRDDFNETDTVRVTNGAFNIKYQ